MILPVMLLLAQDVEQDPKPGEDRVAAAIANYRERTRAEIPCRTTHEDGEVVICARRVADRYRVPFVPAGSSQSSVPMRTAALTKDYSRLPCGQGAFMAQCGPGFGVGVTISSSGSAHMIERQKAP